MDRGRRALLLGVAAACQPFELANAQHDGPNAQMQLGADKELQAILREATRLGLRNPSAASANTVTDFPALDLAEAIERAVSNGTSNANFPIFAARAGLKLSKINQASKDGYDLIPGGPSPAGPPLYPLTEALKHEYAQDFRSAQVADSEVSEIDRVSTFIISNKQVYKTVAGAMSVPWWVIGAIHYREAGLNFMGHLHNGDPLLMQTVHVPAGRPPKPWLPPAVSDLGEIWFQSACDALRTLSRQVSIWTVESMCYGLEGYNGFGCRMNGVKTPYLWSYTDKYKRGGIPKIVCSIETTFQSKWV